MTVILADKQFNDYYHITPNRRGLVSVIPWATTGFAQLFVRASLFKANQTRSVFLRIGPRLTFSNSSVVNLRPDSDGCGLSESAFAS